ncbi:MAG: hypothetical protein GY757_14850 [bacterium]|nr:hypothetical protein [bacterium]
MSINWEYPLPRSGLAGAFDKFLGPGATRAEIVLQAVFPLIAAVAAPLYASHAIKDWTLVQYIVCSFLALDITGGIITNATSSAKRWYHRAGQGFKQHIGVVALHLIHLVLISWLYLELDMTWIVVSGGYLLVSAAIVSLVPQYLQRPISLISYVCALLISIYILQQPEGLEWFLPMFYLKLLVSHLPKEEPYRPNESG